MCANALCNMLQDEPHGIMGKWAQNKKDQGDISTRGGAKFMKPGIWCQCRREGNRVLSEKCELCSAAAINAKTDTNQKLWQFWWSIFIIYNNVPSSSAPVWANHLVEQLVGINGPSRGGDGLKVLSSNPPGGVNKSDVHLSCDEFEWICFNIFKKNPPTAPAPPNSHLVCEQLSESWREHNNSKRLRPRNKRQTRERKKLHLCLLEGKVLRHRRRRLLQQL